MFLAPGSDLFEPYIVMRVLQQYLTNKALAPSWVRVQSEVFPFFQGDLFDFLPPTGTTLQLYYFKSGFKFADVDFCITCSIECVQTISFNSKTINRYSPILKEIA